MRHGNRIVNKKNMKGKLAKKCNKQQNKSKVTNMRNGKGQGKKTKKKDQFRKQCHINSPL